MDADEDGVVDGPEAGCVEGGSQRARCCGGEGGRTDWCVMSMLSGPLRMTRFPPTPAILLSRDWAQVSVTCGRASGAACDRTCSCSKLGDAIVGCEERTAKSRETKSRGKKMSGRETSRIISVNLISSLLSTYSTPFSTHNGPRRLPRGSASRHTPLSPRTPLSPLLLTLPRPQLCRPLRQGTRRVRRDQLQLTDTCHRRVFRRPVPRLSLDDYRRTPSVQTYCDTESAPRSMPFSQPSYR